MSINFPVCLKQKIVYSQKEWIMSIVGKREVLLRKLTRIVEGSSSDRRRSRRQKDEGRNSRKQQQQQESEVLVDRPGRPTCTTCTRLELGRPPGRPTRSTQLSVGHPVDRSVERWKGSVDRPVDRQAGAGCECRFENLLYLRAVVGF